MTFNYHGLYYDLQLNTSILFSFVFVSAFPMFP